MESFTGSYLLDDDVGVSSTHTFDFCQCEHDLVLSVDVCVEQTENVLESILVRHYESHGQTSQTTVDFKEQSRPLFRVGTSPKNRRPGPGGDPARGIPGPVTARFAEVKARLFTYLGRRHRLLLGSIMGRNRTAQISTTIKCAQAFGFP